MSNIQVYLPAKDGSAYWPVSTGDSGKKVEVSIPYADDAQASVRIDGTDV